MDFYTGQIIPVAFGYAPKQTAMCQGQLLPVNQNAALFSLLGITYGGNGQPGGNFGLPNAGGRTLVGAGGGTALGSVGGETDHQLTTSEIPSHSHPLRAVTGVVGIASPANSLPSSSVPAAYGPASNLVGLNAAPLSPAGGGQAHPNMQPSLAINFTIVLYGIYPSRG